MDIDTKREHAVYLYCEMMTVVLSDFEVAQVWESNSFILDQSLHFRGCCLWKLLWFEPSLASYRTVHVVVASVFASTSSNTWLAALSSFLLSRSTCSTILPWAAMSTHRDKEIDFKIIQKYYCWKQNKSIWKNQYSSSQGGRRRGAVLLCSSRPPKWS